MYATVNSPIKYLDTSVTAAAATAAGAFRRFGSCRPARPTQPTRRVLLSVIPLAQQINKFGCFRSADNLTAASLFDQLIEIEVDRGGLLKDDDDDDDDDDDED